MPDAVRRQTRGLFGPLLPASKAPRGAPETTGGATTDETAAPRTGDRLALDSA
ncbi:hypothetical protein ACTVZO_44405 [Streptomyces sp. IBSNAI002]|uniref:hypothetical protein n=1 Tax=Streptomyces sp. IBSNAI002 TaxID=3457500 RepID=UPI003FD1899F